MNSVIVLLCSRAALRSTEPRGGRSLPVHLLLDPLSIPQFWPRAFRKFSCGNWATTCARVADVKIVKDDSGGIEESNLFEPPRQRARRHAAHASKYALVEFGLPVSECVCVVGSRAEMFREPPRKTCRLRRSLSPSGLNQMPCRRRINWDLRRPVRCFLTPPQRRSNLIASI
jgi:hypothetical protein